MSTDQPPPDDPLVAHLSGKRESIRVSSAHPVSLRGANGTFRGRALDISLGGILLVVEDEAFYEGEDDGFTLVTRAFPEGLEIEFDESQTTHAAEVVRITAQGDGAIAMGCRFRDALDGTEAVLLGVTAAQLDDAEVLAPVLARWAKPGVPLSLLVFGPDGEAAGPRLLAQVEAAGEQTLDARVPGPDDGDLALARFVGGDPLPTAIHRGRKRLWSGNARLVSCRAEAGRGITVRLHAERPFGRGVARQMERAPLKAATTG